MARIILGELVNDVRNRLGDNIYSIDKGIHYIRSGPRTIENPDTERQDDIRTTFGVAVSRWFGTLSQTQRDLWNAYAKSIGSVSINESRQGKPGIIYANRKKLIGYNAYIMAQVLRRSIGILTYLDDAPLGEDKINEPTNITLVSNLPVTNSLTVTWTDPAGLGANDRIRVWARCWKWAHAQIVGVVTPSVETLTWDKMRGNDGVENNLTSGNYEVQLDVVKESSLKSPGSEISNVVIIYTGMNSQINFFQLCGKANAGTWINSNGTTEAILHRYFLNSTSAQNDEYEWLFYCEAGNYRLHYHYGEGADRGKAHFLIDDIDIGNVDQYNGATWHFYMDSSITTVLTAGLHSFKLKATDKNPASSAYRLSHDFIQLNKE